MREPKNQMLGTMEPPLMQLSVNVNGIFVLVKVETLCKTLLTGINMTFRKALSIKGVFCPWAIIYCYFEFKLRYLKKPEIVFSWRKIIDRAYRFEGKKRRRVFSLFKSIFLRNRSLSTAGDFTLKKLKIGKGSLYLTENQLSRNEMWYAADNHNFMCHIYAKEL